MTDKPKCEHTLRNDYWGAQQLCGNPAKGKTEDGRQTCGVHLRQEARRKESAIAYQESRATQDRLYQQASELVDQLGGYGITVTAYHGTQGYTGGLIMDAANAAKVAYRLGQLDGAARKGLM